MKKKIKTKKKIIKKRVRKNPIELLAKNKNLIKLLRGPQVPLHLSEIEENKFRSKWYKDNGFKNSSDYYKWVEKISDKYIEDPEIIYRNIID